LLRISLGKKTYGLREKVTVNIQSLQKAVKGNFSLSVRKIDALPSKEAPDAVAFLLGETKKDKNTFALNQIPELRGELLSGTITSKRTTRPQSQDRCAIDYRKIVCRKNSRDRSPRQV
jgi:hypothetical protein